MSYYYWFNKKDLLKKAHGKYHNKAGKEKAAFIIKKSKKV